MTNNKDAELITALRQIETQSAEASKSLQAALDMLKPLPPGANAGNTSVSAYADGLRDKLFSGALGRMKESMMAAAKMADVMVLMSDKFVVVPNGTGGNFTGIDGVKVEADQIDKDDLFLTFPELRQTMQGGGLSSLIEEITSMLSGLADNADPECPCPSCVARRKANKSN